MQILSTASGTMGVMDRPIKAYEIGTGKAPEVGVYLTLVEVVEGEGAIINLGGTVDQATVKITIDGVVVYEGAVGKLADDAASPSAQYNKPVFSLQELQRGRGSGPLFFKNSVKVESMHTTNVAACEVVVFA
ncbi:MULTISPECIES: hypothetical protein [unclassified Halobacteriovorax]|uniref:hypothetical protein n=1 Tax=unclassified Halobacteriovorax TaxID=2639665 RepID=UPI00399C08DC